MLAAQDVVKWGELLAPVTITVVFGTILGNIIVALYKEGIDRRLAIAQRERDRHLARAEVLRRAIAAIVGARMAASSARHTDLNKRSNIEEIAARSQANHESHVSNFERLAGEALVEAERYGLVPEWSGLPDLHLSTYVEFVLSGRLGFTLDADSYKYGQSRDAHDHVSALLRDLRSLVDAEEALAQDSLVGKRKRRMFRAPGLPYLDELKVYFPGSEINVKKLDVSILESRLAQQEWEEQQRRTTGTAFDG